MNSPPITRIILKPGHLEGEEFEYYPLHLGNLGKLFLSYSAIEEHSLGKCYVCIDDAPGGKSLTPADYQDLIQNILWLNLPKIEIINLSDEIKKNGMEYINNLVIHGQVFLQIFPYDPQHKWINPVFINDQEEIKWLFDCLIHNQPQMYDFSIIKIRLKDQASRNPCLISFRKGYPDPIFCLNFKIILFDIIRGINLIFEGNIKESTFCTEIKILYEKLFDFFHIKQPTIIMQRQYQIQDFKYIKNNLKESIALGWLRGWNDPRLLTINGMISRGISPEVIKQFCLLANNDKKFVNIALLNKCLNDYLNKKYHEGIFKPIYGIIDPVEIEIINLPANTVEYILPGHKSFDSVNFFPFSRYIWVEQSDISRLRVGFKISLKSGFVIEIVERLSNSSKFKARYYPEKINYENMKEGIPWISFSDKPIQVDFHLLSKWYLHGDIEKQSYLKYPIKTGYISAQRSVGEILFIKRLGFFKYSESKNGLPQLYRLLSTPF